MRKFILLVFKNKYKVLKAGDQIRMDNLNKFLQKFEKQNGRQITKLSITHSFLDKILKNKMAAKSLISGATESRFFMEVRMDSLNKFWQNLEKNGPQITKFSLY